VILAAGRAHYFAVVFRHLRQKPSKGLSAVLAQDVDVFRMQIATHIFLVYRADFQAAKRPQLAGKVEVDVLL